MTIAYLGNPDGSWRPLQGIASVEIPRAWADPRWDETRTTLRYFTGSLTFSVTPPDRQRLRSYVLGLDGVSTKRRSAMRTAYRAKTRRRNRRRK